MISRLRLPATQRWRRRQINWPDGDFLLHWRDSAGAGVEVTGDDKRPLPANWHLLGLRLPV